MEKEELKLAMDVSPMESMPFAFKIKNNTSSVLKDVSLFNHNYATQSDVFYSKVNHHHSHIKNYSDLFDVLSKFDAEDPLCVVGDVVISISNPNEYNEVDINNQLQVKITLSPISASSPQVVITPDSYSIKSLQSTCRIGSVYFPLSKNSDLIFSTILPKVELQIMLYPLCRASTTTQHGMEKN